MIQQRAVAIGRGLQLRQIMREQLHVIGVDLGHTLDQFRKIVVVRQRVMRFRHADLRIRARALLLAQHERDHARQIGLERQHFQVIHQRQVIFEYRRSAQRLRHGGQLHVLLRFRHLNTALHVANRCRELVDFAPDRCGPSSVLRVASFAVTESRMLLCCIIRASRAERTVLPLSPNSFSNTTRGFHSVGSGCVGLRHDSVCV